MIPESDMNAFDFSKVYADKLSICQSLTIPLLSTRTNIQTFKEFLAKTHGIVLVVEDLKLTTYLNFYNRK